MLGDLRVRGAAVVYRLFDVGYEMQLDKALEIAIVVLILMEFILGILR